MGEWLFGSIGWGVLLGSELSIAIALAAVLTTLGLPARSVGRWFAFAVLVGVVVGIVFGLDLTNRGWSTIGDNYFNAYAEPTRPLAVAVLIVGVVLAVIGFLLALVAARSIGAAIGGLVLGAILGAILGAFTAISFGPQAGAAVGVAIALAVWPIGMGISVGRRGIDMEALKRRLWPDVTITTTKETIEWVREQTPLGPRS